MMSSSTDPSSTPLRLSFCSLPTHLPANPGMATPPLQPPASIPYKWEEAPGKPKKVSGPRKSGPISVLGEVTQRLKLPPRLLSPMEEGAKSKSTFSSTGTAADGRSSALGPCYSFSFAGDRTMNRDKVVWPRRKAPGVRKMCLGKGFEADDFDSDSYCRHPCCTSDAAPYSFSRRYGDHDVGNNAENNKLNDVKISRLRKNRSHASVTTSPFWESIHNSLKQVVSWRRDQKINI